MTMPRRNHGDARREIEKFVAIRVFHANSTPALGPKRIRARIARRNQPVVGFDSGPALRPRKRSIDLWSKLRMHLLPIHRTLTHRILSSADSVDRKSVA